VPRRGFLFFARERNDRVLDSSRVARRASRARGARARFSAFNPTRVASLQPSKSRASTLTPREVRQSFA
jgi:hypothetical protein